MFVFSYPSASTVKKDKSCNVEARNLAEHVTEGQEYTCQMCRDIKKISNAECIM